jgi:hypothetical protein
MPGSKASSKTGRFKGAEISGRTHSFFPRYNAPSHGFHRALFDFKDSVEAIKRLTQGA